MIEKFVFSIFGLKCKNSSYETTRTQLTSQVLLGLIYMFFRGGEGGTTEKQNIKLTIILLLLLVVWLVGWLWFELTSEKATSQQHKHIHSFLPHVCMYVCMYFSQNITTIVFRFILI